LNVGIGVDIQALDIIGLAAGGVLSINQGVTVIALGVAGDVGDVVLAVVEVIVGTSVNQAAPGLHVASAVTIINEAVIVVGQLDLSLLSGIDVPVVSLKIVVAAIALIPTVGQQHEGIPIGLDEQAD